MEVDHAVHLGRARFVRVNDLSHADQSLGDLSPPRLRHEDHIGQLLRDGTGEHDVTKTGQPYDCGAQGQSRDALSSVVSTVSTWTLMHSSDARHDFL